MEQYSQSLISPWIRTALSAWAPLIEGKEPRRYPKNSRLYSQGEPASCLYIVSSGRFRVVAAHPDGGEKQIFILEKGAVGGDEACLGEGRYLTGGVAIVDSGAYTVPAEELRALMAEQPLLAGEMVSMLCRKNRILLNQVAELSFLQSTQRVAQVLLALCNQYGVSRGGGVQISIRFSQQDVGDLVNLSRVTVNGVFNGLTRQNILQKEGGRTVVKDLQALRRLAQGSGPCR